MKIGLTLKVVSSPHPETQFIIGREVVVIGPNVSGLFKVKVPSLMKRTWVPGADGHFIRGIAPMEFWCSKSMVEAIP